ncbi:hypothetical protein LTR96_009539 [Exophiala xenobiotica]|nr:hypothetical protein LTR96_009539 [Exophiala xenobiotica]KAK5333980.1 hypothetical protein LTR98_009891 [Exophiala xenobiotica]KAK5443127.1 hypothetical protein LTR18_005804 [Exophiala xenobiotica]
MSVDLVDLDSLSVTAIINDEIDLISPSRHPDVDHPGSFAGVPLKSHLGQAWTDAHGGANVEMRMDSICCGAHGLSLLVTATKGETTHTLLFDAGPEAEAFERNARRLGLIDGHNACIGNVETIVLSHWHRDHSGGLIKAIDLINSTKAQKTSRAAEPGLAVDIPGDRPRYRGIAHHHGPICLEADPTPDEMTAAGAQLVENASSHAISDGFFAVTGPIPRLTSYETGIPGGIRLVDKVGDHERTWTKDEEIKEERVVVCRLKGKGLVVFTGCSHAGIINIANHVLQTFSSPAKPNDDFYALIGGYHLADASEPRLQNTLTDLIKLNPKLLMPGHCTGWRFRALIEQPAAPELSRNRSSESSNNTLQGRTVPIFAGNTYRLSGI